MMRRTFLGAILPVVTAASLSAQAVPVLQAVRNLTVDGKNMALDANARIKVSANGTIAIAEVLGTQLVLVDRDMQHLQILGTPGEKPGAINLVQWFGWIGDSLWVADGSLRRITVFAPDRSVARTMAFPLSVEGPPGTKVVDHSGWVPMVEGILADGSLVIREFTLQVPGSGGAAYLLRTSGDGQLRSAIGSLGTDEVACFTSPPGVQIHSRRPFCSVPSAAVAPSGRFKASVSWPASVGDSSHFTVTDVGERGDTLYSHSVPFEPILVTRHDLDSVVAAHMKRTMSGGPVQGAADSIKIEAALRATAGTMHPPVLALLAGNDGTVWLEVPSREGGHQWLELDTTGKPVGTVTVPANVRLMQAEHGTVWGREMLADSTVNIVRYRIGPAIKP